MSTIAVVNDDIPSATLSHPDRATMHFKLYNGKHIIIIYMTETISASSDGSDFIVIGDNYILESCIYSGPDYNIYLGTQWSLA